MIFTNSSHPSNIQNQLCAEKAMSHTLKALPLGSSNSIDSKVEICEIIQMREKADKEFCKMVALIDENSFDNKTINKIRYLTKLKYAKIFKIGNCGEHALVALHYLQKHQKSVRAEFAYMTNADHNFVVVGRDPESSLTDSSTWGESAIICDPWAHQIYPASDLPHKLKKICKLNTIEVKGNTPLAQIHTNLDFPTKKTATNRYSIETEEEIQFSLRTLFE